MDLLIVLEYREMLEDWKEGEMVMLHKQRRDVLSCENYTAIKQLGCGHTERNLLRG